MSGINMDIPVAFKREVVYKECLHNHAAPLGKVARDGCYEFLLPNVDESSPEAEALRCAVCNCHRNFHRKQVVYTPIMTVDAATAATPPLQAQHRHYPNSSAATMAAAAAAAEASNAGHINNNNMMVAGAGAPPPGRKQRKERTKFTDEQVRRLASFAERLGWRSKRADREEILNFCEQVGISHRMFVVWLSNNRRRLLNANHQAHHDLPDIDSDADADEN